MKTLLVLVILAALPALPATTVSVVPTSTQAVVNVITDQGGACSYRAAQTAFISRDADRRGRMAPDFSSLVHDVDTTLFPGSSVDSRTGSVIDGSYHSFVLGRRDSEVASDGKRYSRALQANTMHWIGIVCGSDAEIVRTFRTTNPPLGQTYPESAPFDATAFGNYAWPSIDFGDQSKSYVDPMTGLELKRLSSPGLSGVDYQNNSFSNAFDLNSAWTNPSGILAWPVNNSVPSTYSGTGGDPLFVAVDFTKIPYYALSASGWAPFNTVDDIQLRTYGFGTDQSAANRVVLACLSIDSGNTCATPELPVTLPAGSANSGPTAPGSGFPRPAFGSWSGSHPFTGRDFGTVSTTVTAGGHTLTDAGNQSSQYFSHGWKPGGKLLVNGNETYTIAAVVNSSTITTVEQVVTHLSPVPFRSMCAGVRLRKQTGTGSVSLSVGFDIAASAEFQMPLIGTKTLCSQLTSAVSVDSLGSPAPTRQARLCTLPLAGSFGHALIAFFSDNGETRWLSNFNAPAGNRYHAPDWLQSDYNYPNRNGYTASDAWNPTIPTRFYTSITLHGHPVLVQVDYTGTFSAYQPWSATNGYSPDTSFPDDGLTYTVVGGYPSDNRGVDQQAAALSNPYFDGTQWTVWSFLGLLPGGVAQWEVTTPCCGENPAFFVLQDVATGSVTKVIDTIATYPLRFWGNHTTQSLGGSLIAIANILGNKGVGTGNYLGGWFTVYPTQIQQNGSWNTDTSLNATYAEACPTGITPQWQALGATGVNCIQMKAKQPCSDYASAAEAAKYPCPWDSSKSMVSPLAPGDRFWPDYPPAPGGPETMRVVTAPLDLGGGLSQFWVLRHSENFGNLGGPMSGGSATHANGWRAVMIQPEGRGNATVAISADGSLHVESFAISATHSAQGPGLAGGNSTTIMAGIDPLTGLVLPYEGWGIRWNHSGPAQFGAITDYNLYLHGRFAGKDLGGGSMESYMSMQQTQAPLNERKWFLDLHHINPFSGSGQEVYADVGGISASLVSGTSNVYRFTSYPGFGGGSNSKLFPPMAWAGGYLLKDISGPSSAVSDATPFSFCFVYQPGECQAGSAVGEVYTSVPQTDTRGIADGTCIGGWYAQLNPCVMIPHVSSAWAIQVDASRPAADDNYWRKLTQGFSGIGRQYQFGNLNAEPDGEWAFMQCFWCDGVRNEILGVHLPPFPVYDSVNRADFIPIPVQIPAGFGTAAQVRFGYAENGPVSSFFCTSRKEACVTDSAVAPFVFAQSDRRVPAPCASGCMMYIPAVSGRVLYYQVDRLDDHGNVLSSEPMKATAIP